MLVAHSQEAMCQSGLAQIQDHKQWRQAFEAQVRLCQHCKSRIEQLHVEVILL